MTEQQKKLLVIGCATLVILLGVVGLVLRLRRPPAPLPGTTQGTQDATFTGSDASDSTVETSSSPPTSISADLRSPQVPVEHRLDPPPAGTHAPRLAFTYALMTKLPAHDVRSVPVIEYATIDERYARGLASAFGLASVQPFYDGTVYRFIGDTTPGSGVLEISSSSGYTTFTTIVLDGGGAKLSKPNDAIEIARAYLAQRGLWSDDVSPAATYSRTTEPGITFVEWHRTGKPLPIYETLGLLSANAIDPSIERLSDGTVIATSDASDGFARQDDFNTVTVGVDTRGRIVAVTSHLRPIGRVLPDRPLKTPEEAWNELQQNGGVLGLAVPSEKNITSKRWSEIFPEQTASSSEARVRSVVLANVERPDGVSQRYLQPVYIFRGEAKLATGPLADFIVAVPALVDDSLPTPNA